MKTETRPSILDDHATDCMKTRGPGVSPLHRRPRGIRSSRIDSLSSSMNTRLSSAQMRQAWITLSLQTVRPWARTASGGEGSAGLHGL